MARVAAGRKTAHAELELVAVRAGQADAAVKLARPHLEQRREQRLLRGADPFPVARAGVGRARFPG